MILTLESVPGCVRSTTANCWTQPVVEGSHAGLLLQLCWVVVRPDTEQLHHNHTGIATTNDSLKLCDVRRSQTYSVVC